VLAARLEPDAHAAAALCERALAADPACAWAWYGRAFQAMRIKDWREARDSVARALELDPGHLRTRRLEALLLARGGSLDEAIEALEQWLDHARADATMALRSVREAELDLALCYVLADEARRAKRLLEGLEPGDVDEARRFEVLAACEQALGEWQRALDAARRAEGFAPDDPLALVQQALLFQYWFEEPAAAEAAWERVREVAGEGEDLLSLLQRARAQVRVERARQNAAASELGRGDAALPPAP
jgi:tetratricopeptide (TPR) repeat protein